MSLTVFALFPTSGLVATSYPVVNNFYLISMILIDHLT